MFRNILKKKNEIGFDEVKEVLNNSRCGVLSVNGDDDYPYGVPINYFYDEINNKIYFHSAKIGHKVDSIKKSDKVCFTVYGKEEFKDEQWAPFVKSVVIFGRCHMITDTEKSLDALRKFACRYYPNKEMVDVEINKSFNAVQMFEIVIECISGKQIQEK